MLDTLGVINPDVAATLKKVDSIPVDILPTFVTANQLSPVLP